MTISINLCFHEGADVEREYERLVVAQPHIFELLDAKTHKLASMWVVKIGDVRAEIEQLETMWNLPNN